MAIAELLPPRDVEIDRLRLAASSIQKILGPNIVVPPITPSTENLRIISSCHGIFSFTPEGITTRELAKRLGIQNDHILLANHIFTPSEHSGWRYLSLSGGENKENGFTLKEYLVASAVHKVATGRYLGEGLGEGYWSKLSGTFYMDTKSGRLGQNLLITTRSDGLLACSYDDRSGKYKEPASFPLLA